MTIKDYRSVRPDRLKPGDVLVCVVTLHVQHNGHFRVYQRAYPPQMDGGDIPRGGAKLLPKEVDAVAAALFPVAGWAGLKGE